MFAFCCLKTEGSRFGYKCNFTLKTFSVSKKKTIT
jgi:hypothetical protein